MTFIRDNLVPRKLHALRAMIWRNLRVLLVRKKCQIVNRVHNFGLWTKPPSTRFVGWLQNRWINLGSTQNGRPARAKFFFGIDQICCVFSIHNRAFINPDYRKISFINFNESPLGVGLTLTEESQILQAWKIRNFVILIVSWVGGSNNSGSRLSRDFPTQSDRKNPFFMFE